MQCTKSHEIETGEPNLTCWRLPCGCPLTNQVARKAAGFPEVMAAKMLAEERPDPQESIKLANPPLQQGMFVWAPEDGGTLYAVAKINVRGARPKAVIVQYNGNFATRIEMKHDRLPEGWRIVNLRELVSLVRQRTLSQVGVGIWYFRVLNTPVGEAPPKIREEWIGVSLPIMRFLGPTRGYGMRTGAATHVRDTVCVRTDAAIQALKDAGRFIAAKWWEKHYTVHELLFERSEGEVIK